jgi:hypothetical protein
MVLVTMAWRPWPATMKHPPQQINDGTIQAS